MIRKHKKSGVILLSGDVHYANQYHTPCETLTGYLIPEYTSSGMTHNLRSMTKGLGAILEEVVNTYQDPNYSTETVMHKFNFGQIDIDTKNNNVII